MTAEKEKTVYRDRKWSGGGGPSGAVYGLGLIGSLVYYLQHATTFWNGILGIVKALVWPAFLVYHLLQFLHM
jgi:hypothetical protein